MPEFEADTHGMAVAGAGPVGAAGEAVIGTITLPAGGPWKIFNVWSLISTATPTAGESFGGNIRINAVAGDLSPNPAPSRFPTGIAPSMLGATIDSLPCPLHIHDVDYEAAGKAVVQLIYNEPTACTVATDVVMGIIFGKTRPEAKSMHFMDVVRAQVTAAADTTVGTITISEKASEIIAIGATVSQDNVLTTAEGLNGFFRLASDDMKMPPAQYPISCAYAAGIGALINQSLLASPRMLPVIIPVIGGARVDCFIDLHTAVTNAAEVEIFVAYR